MWFCRNRYSWTACQSTHSWEPVWAMMIIWRIPSAANITACPQFFHFYYDKWPMFAFLSTGYVLRITCFWGCTCKTADLQCHYSARWKTVRCTILSYVLNHLVFPKPQRRKPHVSWLPTPKPCGRGAIASRKVRCHAIAAIAEGPESNRELSNQRLRSL